MTTKQKFRSDAFAAIYASAAALQRVGAIDQTTMRQFDETAWRCQQLLLQPRLKIFVSRRMSVNRYLLDTSIRANPLFKSGSLVANSPVAWRSNYWR